MLGHTYHFGWDKNRFESEDIDFVRDFFLNKSVCEKVTESLFELQEQVKKQLQSKTDTLRGGKEKAIFEDGIG